MIGWGRNGTGALEWVSVGVGRLVFGHIWDLVGSNCTIAVGMKWDFVRSGNGYFGFS
jgi:hypothetical protein